MSQNEPPSAARNEPNTASSSSRGNGNGNGRRPEHPRRGRPSRRGRERGRGDHSSGQTPQQPTPPQGDSHVAQSNAPPPRPSRGGRGGGRRRPRGSGANTFRGGAAVPGTARTFGGHLTSADGPSPDSPAELNATAPEFVPGQPGRGHQVRGQQVSGRRAPRPKKVEGPLAPKSTAPDLPTRIHEDIHNLQYECVICTSEVVKDSQVWSCTICWTVVHLPCAKKWHANEIKKDEQNSTAWRCPGCNSPLTEAPGSYHCWCGKDFNPKPIMGLPPHSCGQTCSKARPTCPHPCSLECHAGPCPPCDLMGPSQPCFCGKQSVSKRCTETDYVNGWSCGAPCDDFLPCGEHMCSRTCHSGLCGSCEVPVLSRCYCGKVLKEIPCEERGETKESFNYGQIKDDNISAEAPVEQGAWFTACFHCTEPCDRLYDCGEHKCDKPCHAQDQSPTHCPSSPDVVTHCPCGKTSLNTLLDTPRKTCRDQVPHCAEECGRSLSCGHRCKNTCHTGPCGPCFEAIEVPCRCGRTTTELQCAEASELPQPQCSRPCQAQLSCGRHQCQERCCSGDRKARDRQAARRKNKLTAAEEDIEGEHICTRTCNRRLKCGSHDCQQICHKGPCPSCLEAIFEEISCACGRTVLLPPQPCGTRPPECRYDCAKSPPCGHPKVQHKCHQDDTPCPKCPFLVEKPCLCGKQTLKNQPCWFEEARCGLPCGKKLKCGAHFCKKPCHRDGECEDVGIQGSHCNQSCGKTRKSCDHACQDTCHAPFACKEDRPCAARVSYTCDCRRRKQEGKCGASASNAWPAPRKLTCDDECARLRRNAQLAEALKITPDHTDDHIPYSDTTLDMFAGSQSWCTAQERELRDFAADTERRVLRFKPMPPSQRALLHSLAEDFGLDSESQDSPPHRSVSIYKTPRFVSAPRKTVAQAHKLRATQAAEAARAATAAIAAQSHVEPFNALLLSTPKFALTVDDVEEALGPVLSSQPSLAFATHFLPSDEVLLRASSRNFANALSAQALEAAVSALKPAVARIVARGELARSVGLCHADADLVVLRRERGGSSAGGWNTVVGRAAQKGASSLSGPSSSPLAWGVGGVAGAVGSEGAKTGKVTLGLRKKKVVEQEPVEEDWEAAAEKLAK